MSRSTIHRPRLMAEMIMFDAAKGYVLHRGKY